MRYSGIWQFEAKMCMLILAAINMIIFHIGSFRSVAKWDQVGRGRRWPPGSPAAFPCASG